VVIKKHVSLNIDVRGLGQSATLSINKTVKRLRSKGRKIFNFGLGQSPFPVPASVVEALRQHAHEKDYLPVEGLPALRQTVAEHHRKRDNISSDPDNVLIGPGSKELMFLLQVVFYGELVVPTPCWVSYVPQAHILGRKVKLIDTRYKNKWHLTAEDLKAFCEKEKDKYRPRIVVLNYPGNPDGMTYTVKQLKDIAEVARRYKVIILSDEIYGPLHHKARHVSISRFYPEGTIVSGGLSKWCGAGGWRLGTFIFPPSLDWLMKTMASVASETYTAVSAPIQHAAIRAFKGGIDIERYLRNVRGILSTLGMRCYDILKETDIKVHPPEGAFYMFIDLSRYSGRLSKRKIKDSKGLCEALLKETGVAMLPGEPFGRPSKELTARMAYIDFNGERALAASEGLTPERALPDDFLDTYCGNVVKGTQRLADWVNTL
jgi:aspartate aminotransferase